MVDVNALMRRGRPDPSPGPALSRHGRLYVGDRRNKRVQVFDQKGKFLKQWNHLSTKDGKILERIEGQRNATAVTVDANDAIYIAEVNGTNVRKLVKKKGS